MQEYHYNVSSLYKSQNNKRPFYSSLGIIPDVKYDPQIGILGLGISVTLTRPGYSIRKRSKHKASVGKTHIITNQEAKDYLAKEYGVTIA